jgi:hypothetical protein
VYVPLNGVCDNVALLIDQFGGYETTLSQPPDWSMVSDPERFSTSVVAQAVMQEALGHTTILFLHALIPLAPQFGHQLLSPTRPLQPLLAQKVLGSVRQLREEARGGHEAWHQGTFGCAESAWMEVNGQQQGDV